jgi:NADPH2:quinone reductase
MMKAIRIHQHGGPEVLECVDLAIPQASSNSVLVKNTAIGVNFVDVQHRMGGIYPVTLPLIPGTEAAGIVEAIGEEVSRFRIGQRVAYAGYMGGNYAEYTLVPEDQLVPVPDGLSEELAAASLLQGMTALCLSHTVYPIQQGDWVLVHAAAGGVGSLLVQMAKLRGAKVIGTVSNAAKADAAKEAGADYVIRYQEQDFEAETLSITAGKGVQVVYDAIGKTTFDKSIRVLAQRGYMVVYGQTTGAVPPFNINDLSGLTGVGKGSLFLTWAALSHYNTSYEDLASRASIVFEMLLKQELKVLISGRYPLENAAEAHRLLEARGVSGKLLLIP